MAAKVLVIDDERGPRESLRILLKNDYEVHLADNVDEGIGLLKKESPDVVVLDIRMPGKNGIEGLREIREIDTDVAVIILTGYAELETAQSAIHHGANEYMKKPFDAVEMRDTISRNIERTDINRRRNQAFRKIESLDGEIEQMVGEKEQMASLGLASSALAHDLRNPLMVMHAYTEMLSEDLKRMKGQGAIEINGDIETYLENIENNIERCHKLTKDWNLLGKPEAIKYEDISLEDILNEMLRDAEVIAAESGVQIEKGDFHPNLYIKGEPSLIERAFWNIAKNAVQAAAGKPDGKVQIGSSKTNGDIAISFKDNGCGIEPDQIEAIFEPLKSGKPISAGFGLGLFITKEVIEKHNGSVQFDSKPGDGTTVVVRLPIA